jgi:hypothetical protein
LERLAEFLRRRLILVRKLIVLVMTAMLVLVSIVGVASAQREGSVTLGSMAAGHIGK